MTNAIEKLEGRERIALTFIFVVIFSLLIFDVVEDLQSGASFMHVGLEATILFLASAGITIQWGVYFLQKHSIYNLGGDLKAAREDLKAFKEKSRKYVEGFSQQIDFQLSKWELTKAEKEIALLILKGLSNREICEVRQTSEKTIRQQVSSVLAKSNLSSRLELSAFFLEDILLIAPDQE